MSSALKEEAIMKTIYIESIPSYHEQEEMHFSYAVYENDVLINKKSIYHDYRKPGLAGLYSIMQLFKVFPEYKGEALTLIVNDGALLEQINGTTTTKNKDVLKVAQLTRKHISKFSDRIQFMSVAGKHEAMTEWKNKLDG